MDQDHLVTVEEEGDYMDIVIKDEPLHEFESVSNIGGSTEVDPLLIEKEDVKFPLEQSGQLDNPVTECVIRQLHKKPFSQLSFTQKKEVVSRGRPRPAIPSLDVTHKEKNRVYTRHFKITQYESVPWLSGSQSLGKLFCWPCLLFSKDANIWTKDGYANLNSLHTAIRKHERSINHLTCSLNLNCFGESRIELQIDEQQRIHIYHHNEKVKKNRSVLKRLIDTVCLLARQELPFRARDETTDSLFNKGNYVEQLYFLATYDSVLSTHLETATVFRGTSNHVQNDLIAATSAIVINAIKQEITEASFVAILLDETTDISNFSQMSTVLRYVTREGKAVERFVGYTDMSADKTAEALYQHVLNIVEEFAFHEKLIAQSYDGAAVMAGHLNGLHTRVLERFPTALFVHCMAHKLNLVLQDVCKHIQECKRFFTTLSGLAAFFSESPKRSQALHAFVPAKLPKVCPTSWNFSSGLVNTVSNYFPQLIEFFEHLTEDTNSGVWDQEAATMGQGFLAFLTNPENCFLLKAFSKLFSFTEVLYNILQKQMYDVGSCLSHVQDTRNMVLDEREKFDELWREVERAITDNNLEVSARKRHRGDDVGVQTLEERSRRRYCEIIDLVSNQLDHRFSTMERFKFIKLLDPSSFVSFRVRFPIQTFNLLQETYGNFFDTDLLKTELTVLYATQTIEPKHPFELVPFMCTRGLHASLPEVYRLGCLFLTIPSTTASMEKSFSALKRIKSHVRATTGQERLSSLSLLSIEKRLLQQLREKEDFYENVMKEFLSKERRVDLEFK